MNSQQVNYVLFSVLILQSLALVAFAVLIWLTTNVSNRLPEGQLPKDVYALIDQRLPPDRTPADVYELIQSAVIVAAKNQWNKSDHQEWTQEFKELNPDLNFPVQ